jgi:hypothetical protein
VADKDLIHGAYKAYRLARQGRYPDARYKLGRLIKDRFVAIDETYPDELLTPELRSLKQHEIRPAIVFLAMHPGWVDSEDGPQLAYDFRRFQNRIDNHIRRLELATDGHSEASVDLYERMRTKLLKCEDET